MEELLDRRRNVLETQPNQIEKFDYLFGPQMTAPIKVLVISVRISQSREVFLKYKGVLPDLCSYQDDPSELWERGWRSMVISIESLLRLKLFNHRYDVVVLDECKSVIDQLFSQHVRLPITTRELFLTLLRKAKKVVAMDENIDASCLYLLTRFRTGKGLFIKNTFKNREGHVVKMASSPIRNIAKLMEMYRVSIGVEKKPSEKERFLSMFHDYVKEEARIETEEARIETEKARIETENARIKTEDARIETEDARIKTEDEDARVETEDEDARVETEDEEPKGSSPDVNEDYSTHSKQSQTVEHFQIVCATKNMALFIARELYKIHTNKDKIFDTDTAFDEETGICLVCSETKKTLPEGFFQDLKVSMEKVRVFIFTSTITVGIDIRKWTDHAFAFFDAKTITHDVALQMVNRSREISSKTLHCSVSSYRRTAPVELDEILEELEDYTNAKGKFPAHIYSELEDSAYDARGALNFSDPFVSFMVIKTQTKALSERYHRECIQRVFERSGWIFEFESEENAMVELDTKEEVTLEKKKSADINERAMSFEEALGHAELTALRALGSYVNGASLR